MIRNDPYRFIVLVVAAILILVVSGDCLHALKLSVAGSDIAIKGAWYGIRYRDATGDGVTTTTPP